MISGDLIRVKNMVDDCVRLARSIQREAERLTPEEQSQLTTHLAASSGQLSYLVGLLSADQQTPTKS